MEYIAKLAKQIQSKLSAQQKNKLDKLEEKQSLGQLSELEYQELGELVILIEKIHANRILAIGQLAELRNQSIDEISQEFGFVPISWESVQNPSNPRPHQTIQNHKQ